MRRSHTTLRCGWLTTESIVALAILAVVAVAVASLAGEALVERKRAADRQDALEATANVLEAARAKPFDDLTPAWATSQQLPEALAARWPNARLSVHVEDEPNRPRFKRVTVEITGVEPCTVSLTGFFASRHEGGAE